MNDALRSTQRCIYSGHDLSEQKTLIILPLARILSLHTATILLLIAPHFPIGTLDKLSTIQSISIGNSGDHCEGSNFSC